MLTRKITVCSSLFLLMILLGWGLDHHIRLMNDTAIPIPEKSEGFYIRSTNFLEPANINMPFLPREYVRIIRRESE